MLKNKIIKSIIFTLICSCVIVTSLYTITYAKYSFNYIINAAEIEIIV